MSSLEPPAWLSFALGAVLGLPSHSAGEMLPSALLVHVSPAVLCPASLQACLATMFQCVHFWGWKSLESSFGHSNDSINDQMTVFQTNMCSVLVRRSGGGGATRLDL